MFYLVLFFFLFPILSNGISYSFVERVYLVDSHTHTRIWKLRKKWARKILLTDFFLCWKKTRRGKREIFWNNFTKLKTVRYARTIKLFLSGQHLQMRSVLNHIYMDQFIYAMIFKKEKYRIYCNVHYTVIGTLAFSRNEIWEKNDLIESVNHPISIIFISNEELL